ncbi:MAG: bifunctional riboflavin kinase/FAD synthetase [Actinomycetales bacterium]|nr:bifunctional riboflavin kinase/FAD synthetase [Actinomycetales bacterium]
MDATDVHASDLAHVPEEPQGCVVCIGVFDGVHRGHQSLIALGRTVADRRGVPLVAITFDPHPMAVVGQQVAPPALASLAMRRELLRRAGADEVDVLDFDEEMSQLSPEEFIEQLLVDRLHVRAVVVGDDFRFGHRAAGSVDTLREAGERVGFEVVPAPLVGEGEHRWSSTRIRTLLAEGDVAAAAVALGRLYCVEGVVVHGDHRGRELGYPTANLGIAEHLAIPADGVYSGWLWRSGERFPAAISVGTNPTFEGAERRVEAYVLDRVDLDLYGEQVRLEFVDWVRGMEAFPSVESLVVQMAADVDRVRQQLG